MADIEGLLRLLAAAVDWDRDRDVGCDRNDEVDAADA